MPGQHDDGYAPGGAATPPPGSTPVPAPGANPVPPQASGPAPAPAPTPPVQGAAPSYPAVTPPYPVSTPPYPTSTPPYPASTPPYPASAPPYPTSTPPYPTSTPPYPMSAPPGGGYPPTAPYQTAAGPQHTGGLPATAVMPRSRPRPPAWLIVTLVAAIVVALAGAGTLAWSRFWGGGGVNERTVEFTPFQQIGSVPGPGSNYGRVFTTVTDDRAYVAHVREDDKLEIRAVQASTATELWRAETSIAAPGWEQVASVSVGVAALTDGISSSTPETLVVFDTEGREIWKYPIRRDDQIFFLGDAVVVVDRFANQLVGLRATDGTQTWRLDNPANGSRKDTAVYPVNSYARLTGPGDFAGIPFAPRTGDQQVVQVGADRSVRVIDARTGAELRSRPNVADHTDPVAVVGGTLYVAAQDSRSGYRVVAHDLATLGEPRILHTAADPTARAEALTPCGAERVCMLETIRYDDETAQVIVLGGEKPVQWAVPGGARDLSAVGEHLIVTRSTSPQTTLVYALDGSTVLDAQGTAVRLNARSLLLFADRPSSSLGDESVEGVSLADGARTPLGLLRDVRPANCSWNTEVIVCPADKSFVFHRFATG